MVVLVVAGCGARQDQGAPAPPGSIEGWIARMAEAQSVRFEVDYRSEDSHSRWRTRKGEMSPLSKGSWQVGTPKPVTRMVERRPAYRGDAVLETVMIERFSREYYAQDTRMTLPQGKSWVKLNISTNAMWAQDLEQAAYHTLNDLHPGSFLTGVDRHSLVISPGVNETVDGTPTWRYALTASANVESNPNAAHGKPVEVTVWVNHNGLPVRAERRATSASGHRNTTLTKLSDWDTTPAVQVPPDSEVTAPETATWKDQW
nr:hypothetical protein [Kibdelosporangium sp. MJ126-NF4]